MEWYGKIGYNNLYHWNIKCFIMFWAGLYACKTNELVRKNNRRICKEWIYWNTSQLGSGIDLLFEIWYPLLSYVLLHAITKCWSMAGFVKLIFRLWYESCDLVHMLFAPTAHHVQIVHTLVFLQYYITKICCDLLFAEYGICFNM